MNDKKLLIKTYILYIVLLSWFILCRLNIEEFFGKYNGISLIPFVDKDYYTSTFARYACEIGNVVSFVPAGIYLSFYILIPICLFAIVNTLKHIKLYI